MIHWSTIHWPMTHWPFIAGAYGATLAVCATYAIAALVRLRGSRRRLAALEAGADGPDGRAARA